MDALLACFTGTRPELVALEPSDVPTPKVGHFGLFRAVPGSRVWPAFERFVLGCYAAE